MRNTFGLAIIVTGTTLLPAEAFAATGGPGPPPADLVKLAVAELSSISATMSPSGAVQYQFAGYHPNLAGVIFTGTGNYDPKTGDAKERLEFPQGKISSSAKCMADPWADGFPCSKIGAGSSISISGGVQIDVAAFELGAPAGAMLFSAAAHNRAKAALAEAFKNRPTPTRTFTHTPIVNAQTIRKNVAGGFVSPATPTPIPKSGPAGTVSGALRAGGGTSFGASSAGQHAPTATPTNPPPPTPTPAPLYGAVYIGGPTTMKAGQVASVHVSVRNTSSQTWPAGGVFHLAFHWYRGGVEIVHDGDRTLMPINVAPGATVNLIAKVTAPPAAGAAVLRWDMVRENVWFSDQGVPSAPHNVNVVP